MSTTPTPTWFVQIVFGRYTSVSTISWSEIIVLSVVGVIMMYVYLFLLRFKFGRYTQSINQLPSNYLPLGADQMSRPMYSRLINDSVRTSAIFDAGIRPSNNQASKQASNQPLNQPLNQSINKSMNQSINQLINQSINQPHTSINPSINQSINQCGDPGWGNEGKYGSVHFSTSIAKSYHLLEQIALTRRPGLSHSETRTIREYVSLLRQAFPRLYEEICERYLFAYERAVFSYHRYDEIQYDEFMDTVMEMVAIIGEKRWRKRQTNGNGIKEQGDMFQ